MNPRACLLIAALLSAHASSWSAELQKKVLIIGIDGVRPDALAVAQTPNLDALKAQGAFSDCAVSDPITHSAAAWSSFFTSVWGDKHGVQDPGNSLAGNQFANYPSFFRRLELVNSNWTTVGFARWAPLTNIMRGADVLRAFGSDDAIVSAAVNQLTNVNLDVFYLILLAVDDAGHTYGFRPTATNYVKAIETADTRVGQVINALTNRPTYGQEDWLIISLSDHGGHDGTVPETRLTFHLFSGPAAARGTLIPVPSIVDCGIAVLTHMGVPIDPAWNLDGRLEGFPLPPPRFGTNLICNGDAESNSSTNNYAPNRGIAWWSDYTSITLAQYGAHPDFPSLQSPGPTNRALNFFLGGTNTGPSISQLLDLSGIAAQIDDPGVDYVLSGCFGGIGAFDDATLLTARFLDATNAPLATNNIGGVTAADRTNTTALLERSAPGTLPAGTRRVEFVLSAQAAAAPNHAIADNLAFVLTARPEPAPQIVAAAFTNAGWQVQFDTQTNRLYQLERSVDLADWTTLPTLMPGNGGRLALTDPAPPPSQAFYRILARRP